MKVHWEHKKKRSGGMSNPQIDEWYDLALANGAHVNIEDVKDKNAGVYEAHVHELAKRNRTESLEYWRKLLAGYEQKAVIPSHGRLSEEQRSNSSHAFLDI